MKFTLKPYQEEAVEKILENLSTAAKQWRSGDGRNSFSLAATTGAGKTVMAAAAFEALFYGDDNYDFEAQKNAIVIWFSDDPSLNEQTRFRLLEASDRLDYSDLVVVKNTFCEEQLRPGKIYFLNSQKLGKKSLLVRGHDSEDSVEHTSNKNIRPDLRANSIWDTLTNTIEDPNLTLYLVLDEAHRGMGAGIDRATNDDKTTIIKRLINGFGSVPAIPIVLGISATVDRFNAAMAGSEDRNLLPNVVVDSKKVQESGLLKDTIVLEIPEKVGEFDKGLLARATEKLKELDHLWKAHAESQGDSEIVRPLMVLQVPNTPNHREIGEAIDVINKTWNQLSSPHSFAHVFGERKTVEFGPHKIQHISPERVQESSEIRVLIAKDAISTGWDCPRSEVMVSFRPAIDRTHITQLLGRMIRTPLARRIEGNEKLNSVHCILPFFDTKTVEAVAEKLMEGGDDAGPLTGRKVLIDPTELFPNKLATDDVWEVFRCLSSQTLPKKSTKPIKRLTAFAHELASDGILNDAGKIAHKELHKILDDAQERYFDQITESTTQVLNVRGISLHVDMASRISTFDEFTEDADLNVIEEKFKRSGRLLSSDLTRTYSEYLAKEVENSESEEDDLIGAHISVVALSLVEEVIQFVENRADRFSRNWFDKYELDIRKLPDERQDVYRDIKAWSQVPQDIKLIKPTSWMVATTQISKDGQKNPLPKYEKHLMSDPRDGLFPCDLNTWEVEVLKTESSREGFICWYRNPSHPGHDSLGIPYEIDSDYAMVRPDFLFFSKGVNGEVRVNVIDPHGLHFEDALPKLDGMAKYAQRQKDIFYRFESVAKVDDKFRVINLMDETVREAIFKSNDPEDLFRSEIANDYK